MPSRGHPTTDLARTLEDTKRQFFYLIYILKLSLVETRKIFDRIFEEMSKVVGIRIHVSPSQWQSRKDKWDKEWSFGPGGTGPTDAVLMELDQLPLWHDGTLNALNIPLGSVSLYNHSTASLYLKSNVGDNHGLFNAGESHSELNTFTQLESPTDIPSSTWMPQKYTCRQSGPEAALSHAPFTQIPFSDLLGQDSTAGFVSGGPCTSYQRPFGMYEQPTSYPQEWLPEDQLEQGAGPEPSFAFSKIPYLSSQGKPMSDDSNHAEQDGMVRRTSTRKRRPISFLDGRLRE